MADDEPMSRDLYDLEEGLISEEQSQFDNVAENTVLPLLDLYFILLPFLTHAERGILRLASKNTNQSLILAEEMHKTWPFSPDYVPENTMREIFSFFSGLLRAGWRSKDVVIHCVTAMNRFSSSTLPALLSQPDVPDSVNAAVRDIAYSASDDFLDDLIVKIEAVLPPNNKLKNAAMIGLAILLLPVEVGLWTFAMLSKNALMLGNSCCSDACFLDTCQTVSCADVVAGSSDVQDWLSDRSDPVDLTWVQQQCVAFLATNMCKSYQYTKDYTMIDGGEGAGISVGCNITPETGIAWTLAVVSLLFCILALIKFRSHLVTAVQDLLPASLAIGSKKIPFSEVNQTLDFLKTLKGWKEEQAVLVAETEKAALEASSLAERHKASAAFFASKKSEKKVVLETMSSIPSTEGEGLGHVAIDMGMS